MTDWVQMTSDFHFKGKLTSQIWLRITLHLENFTHQIGPAILWYIQGLHLYACEKNSNAYNVNILILNSHISFAQKILAWVGTKST